MERIRKPFQGVGNIIRFNWPVYIGAVGLVLSCFLLANYFGWANQFLILLVAVVSLPLVVSVGISYYVYDWSGLYKFDWLDDLDFPQGAVGLNIHAGFDETSVLLKEKFPKVNWEILDFYDPKKHTELSVKRARKKYPADPDAQQISTSKLLVETGSVAKVFLFFAAHEIRDEQERRLFFLELNRVLEPDGQIVIVEHLRDWRNLLAYNIGFFHFQSRSTWLSAFESGKLTITKEFRINPFITTFILSKNGTSS